MTTPHILVVDDERDIRELVKEILEDEGYEVSVAENGAAARDARRTRHEGPRPRAPRAGDGRVVYDQ